MSKSDGIWSAGEMLGNAESSIGTVMRTAVDDYYKGQDLDTAQAIRSAANDTEARMMITAMRQGRWQDLLLVAGVTNMMERAVAETIDDNTIDPNAKLEFGAGGHSFDLFLNVADLARLPDLPLCVQQRGEIDLGGFVADQGRLEGQLGLWQQAAAHQGFRRIMRRRHLQPHLHER